MTGHGECNRAYESRMRHCTQGEGSRLTSMPQIIMPGTTSRVLRTTMSSAVFMSRADMPGAPSTMPILARRFTPARQQPSFDTCPLSEAQVTRHKQGIHQNCDCALQAEQLQTFKTVCD